MFFGLNAWQFLLWLAAIIMIASPFICGIAKAIIDSKYKAKAQFIGTIANAAAQAMAKTLEEQAKRIEEKKNKAENDVKMALKHMEELMKHETHDSDSVH